ncbi:MAG TPA: tRNA (N6-isopentenyl adenosine(37)-C2)-methylthiotransferase MiaB [Thermodesulfovibrionia bacterium]|nr:tRNA (N6-isopentenyl adenosine(37)-C2)-methylthiotransferase MiaB [Thermodesulfovibrionia bacterium]
MSEKLLYVKTFGCQMNVHDSEKLKGVYTEHGYGITDLPDAADVIIINTCSVRQKAEQKFYSELGRLRLLKQHKPKLDIVVVGCIAQQEGKKILSRFPYVSFICGPGQIDKVAERLKGTYCHVTALEESDHYTSMTLPVKRESQFKAFLSIMYGCDNFCSYCVVPFTRGRERSRPIKEILLEAESLASDGVKEVTLIGQNVNSYGKGLDKGTDFPFLLEQINKINGIERIRFVTSHPRDLTGRLIDAMANLPKVCEHIHLPLQSGSAKVLKRMNRGYTYAMYEDKISALRSKIPDIAITSDFIAGFPGESDDDFIMTLMAIQTIQFDGIFAFTYSNRPFTRALTLDGHLSETVKKERLTELLKLQDEITYAKNLALEGKTFEVLVEGQSETHKEIFTGRTRTNKIVNFYPKTKGVTGTFVMIKVIRGKMHSLDGEIV